MPRLGNSIASQLMKNGEHRKGDCKSTRLVKKELSGVWKITTLMATVSLTLQVGGACCCSQTTEARKVSGIGLHLPRVYTPCRVDSQILVLRLPQYLHVPTQNSKDLQKSTNSCNPKARKSSRDSSTLVSIRSLTHCSHRSKRASDTGSRPVDTRQP